MYPKYLPAFPDLSLNRLSLPFHQDAISATPTAIEPEGGHGCKNLEGLMSIGARRAELGARIYVWQVGLGL